MNQLKALVGVAGVVVGLALSTGHAILIDDFNNYASSPYIQDQNSAWSRFGAATTDGITSIAGGVGGTRGAAYSGNFAAGPGSIKYTFSTIQNLTATTTLTIDLSIPLNLEGLQVQAVVYDNVGGTSQTIYQTAMQSLTSSGYQTFTFELVTGNVTRTQGQATLASTLANASAIGFRFSSVGASGAVSFDNVYAVPEPSVSAGLAIAGVALGLYRLRSRRREIAG